MNLPVASALQPPGFAHQLLIVFGTARPRLDAHTGTSYDHYSVTCGWVRPCCQARRQSEAALTSNTALVVTSTAVAALPAGPNFHCLGPLGSLPDAHLCAHPWAQHGLQIGSLGPDTSLQQQLQVRPQMLPAVYLL